MEWEAVIGLEVHAQLLTASKLFCSCPTTYGARPNTQVCPICLGHPGTLPTVNKRAVELAVRAGLAVDAEIYRVSVFARKNYFYPDLPKNYQITQYDHPVCAGGGITINTVSGMRRIGLTRIHLEEDAGKSIHPEHSGESVSKVDLNRCGVPLIEIVSQPDLRTPEEARELLERLRRLLVWIEVCDGNMQEGSLRCDANVSLREKGSEAFGTRTELKNLNSFRFLERALHFEIDRHRALLEAGEEVEQETLLWDEDTNQTRTMRDKEDVHDYRYFPEPDLPPVVVSRDWVDEIRSRLPELPDARKERLCTEFGLSEDVADSVTASSELADYFEQVRRSGVAASLAADWVSTELQARLNEHDLDLSSSPVGPAALGELLREVDQGRLSRRQAKEVLVESFQTGVEPLRIIEDRGLSQESSTSVLSEWIRTAIDKNPKQVSDYLDGHVAVLNFFTGEVMKLSQGKANPNLVASLLRAELERRKK